MNISIFGLGYVGAVSLACLARDGHKVYGVDIDENKLNLIKSGRSPIIEEGIQELMKSVVDSGRVEVTNDISVAVNNTNLSFVCVGTPSAPNGSQDLYAMERVSEQIGKALVDKEDYHVIVIRSTIQPGTIEETIKPIIEEFSGKQLGSGFGLGFQPEFLREGSSIEDYDNPPYTVMGGDSQKSVDAVREIFSHLSCEFFSTSIRTAEMLKYACNTFHALKTTFANEIGRVSQAMGVDSHEVMRLVCEDKNLNISPAYMKPGFAFGGSCLPKDLRALLYLAKINDVNVPMLSGVIPSNKHHIERTVDVVLETKKRSIGMIGLSFKSGTDDLRESPLVVLAERFIGKGLELKIYDPEVNVSRLIGANKQYINETIPHIGSLMSDECKDVITNSEIVIMGLKDKALIKNLFDFANKDQLVIDLVNIPDREKLASQYLGVCW